VSNPERERAWGGPWQFTIYGSIIDRLRNARQLRIGIESTRHEGIFASFKNDEFTGIDIELVRFIIRTLNEKLGFSLEKDPMIIQAPWGAQLFGLPLSDRVDLIISGMTRTRKREKDYGIVFSEPYLISQQTVTVRKNSGVESVKDLAGKRLVRKGKQRT
jgi:polar amino acid transport system substrate-binding protein